MSLLQTTTQPSRETMAIFCCSSHRYETLNDDDGWIDSPMREREGGAITPERASYVTALTHSRCQITCRAASLPLKRTLFCHRREKDRCASGRDTSRRKERGMDRTERKRSPMMIHPFQHLRPGRYFIMIKDQNTSL